MNHASRSLGSLTRATFALSFLAAVFVVPSAAMADGDPDVSVGKDGTIDGTVVVGAPPDVVQSYLADVRSLRTHSKDVVSVDIVRDGECQLVTTLAKSLVELTYVARRCPTATGYVETLLDSEMMNDYYAEWFVTPVSSGIEIRFRMRTDLNLPVPGRIIRSTIKSNVTRSLELMQKYLGGPHAPPSQVAAD